MKPTIPLIIGCIFYANTTYTQIKNYQKYIGEYTDSINHQSYIVIRKFTTPTPNRETCVDRYIGVHPESLETAYLSTKNIKKSSWDDLKKKYASSTYIKMLNHAQTHQNKSRLQNSGITNTNNQHSFVLTTDLCPSSKALEYDFYKHTLKNISYNPKKLVPVGIAITGRWIHHHKNDLQWLLSLNNKTLSITWINHSYNHRYIQHKAYASNFLLIKDTKLATEILELEKLMLQNKLKLSVYFRFPGLISNTNLYNQILDYGLMPLGADAWIAKNQFPKKGSIVLVHGNGNEHIGIAKFKKWLHFNKDTLRIKSINNSMIDAFKHQLPEQHKTN